MRFLLAGWFSFEGMNATAGDLLARDLVAGWLAEGGHEYEIAVAPPFEGGIAWQRARPGDYAGVVFVCGPFGNGPPLKRFLARFAGVPLIGLNLSMLQDLESWNPFALLIERDSNRTTRPDLVFLTDAPRVPVVGLALVHPQKEYGARARHEIANAAIGRLIASRPMAVVEIDTRLDDNKGRLRSPAEVESLIARMDVILTTRLHGMVMALKNSLPALAVDPVAGGAKVMRQARVLGWPAAFGVDALDERELGQALDFCLSAAGRARAREVGDTARKVLEEVRGQLLRGLAEIDSARGRLPPGTEAPGRLGARLLDRISLWRAASGTRD